MNTGIILNNPSTFGEERQGNEQNLRGEALDLYFKMSTSGKLHRTLNFLQHKSRRLKDIANAIAATCRLNRHFAGLHNVSIDQIKGTDSREGDFDDSFYPLHDRMRSRWLGVAAARLSGKELPPVELIKVGGIFYVQDGHHRISVAKALGEEFVDAEVIDLDC
ncbi:MAG: ParB-like nuclease domain-containing protein [Chloroflexota bacterium]|nr:MAG: ParB-like nuclease domain-containing protein [Chloroflexota bacterium]